MQGAADSGSCTIRLRRVPGLQASGDCGEYADCRAIRPRLSFRTRRRPLRVMARQSGKLTSDESRAVAEVQVAPRDHAVGKAMRQESTGDKPVDVSSRSGRAAHAPQILIVLRRERGDGRTWDRCRMHAFSSCRQDCRPEKSARTMSSRTSSDAAGADRKTSENSVDFT